MDQLRTVMVNVGSEAKAGALTTARSILTEHNTDALIEVLVPRIKAKLPMWLKWLPLGTILDKILPGTLLSVIEEVLS